MGAASSRGASACRIRTACGAARAIHLAARVRRRWPAPLQGDDASAARARGRHLGHRRRGARSAPAYADDGRERLHDITDTEHLEHLRDQFFAAAAHALKTPVAVIKAHVQLLSARPGRSSAARGRGRPPVRSHRPPGPEPARAVARALAHRCSCTRREVDLGPLVESKAARRRLARLAAARGAGRRRGSPRVHADAERLELGICELDRRGVAVPRSPDAAALQLARCDGDRRRSPCATRRCRRSSARSRPTASTTTSASAAASR